MSIDAQTTNTEAGPTQEAKATITAGKPSGVTGAVAVISMVLASIAMFTAYKSTSTLKELQARLDLTPPTVIIDFGAQVASYGNAQGAELEKKMMQTQEAVQGLKEAGYLVLDAANIVAAPDDIYLPSEGAE